DYYELRLFHLGEGSKLKPFEDFLCQAAIPTLNRIGIEPVGVFGPAEGDDPYVYVLLRHKSLESVATLTQKLGDDDTFMDAGGEFLMAPKDDPAYARFESSLLVAFDNHPRLTVPSKKESRVFQLRIYESRSTERGQKKIEMFNEGGEIDIFHKVGLNPVFFGEALVGSKLPNLTYMVGFDDEEAMKAAWKAFLAHPDWEKLKQDTQYDNTVSNITNIVLRPLACSQI
ncbi:MAG: NIPSNAP family protein, partial [Planctomycetes bacterium]|nr:NIPSNAP family protein [Planctomycetota bacterium]